ncbi:MAG: indolepyruvate ferredoxin oxidoreductase subunit alpha [Chloroflexota bacterium]
MLYCAAVLRLLSGNEAFAWGAYHSGVQVAAAYPGTPSTEILECVARFEDVYAEWSTNEKVAMEVALGAAYTGVRSLVSLKHVGLNVAMDPFMAASITGISGGFVVISADDPGMHSSQNEQDNRHYARLAKVPMLEPADSQEAYDFMSHAFAMSEEYDTPVLVRSTTRISHSKSAVDVRGTRALPEREIDFKRDMKKYVMLPGHARLRHPLVEERLVKLAEYAERFPLNKVEPGDSSLGIVTSGIAYQYAREVFPRASFLKLGMVYPLPLKMIGDFAGKVDRVVAIEELDPFLEEQIQGLGIEIQGKEFIPRVGELNPRIVEEGARRVGLLPDTQRQPEADTVPTLPKRPPLLCPGCPHTGTFFVLSSIGRRLSRTGQKAGEQRESPLVITGDIGCYTLGSYPPLSAMDTTACMGASIGQALGMEKAGLAKKVVAVIGDSTFLHSGITPLVDAVYNEGKITVVILDNSTTAMTGHQEHPGTGVSAQGKKTKAVDIEYLVRGIGVEDVKVVDAFDMKELRSALRNSVERDELSVVIVRGPCAVRERRRATPMTIDQDKCNQCGVCLQLGCPAVQSSDGQVRIDSTLCIGDFCGLCRQICPKGAIREETGSPRAA